MTKKSLQIKERNNDITQTNKEISGVEQEELLTTIIGIGSEASCVNDKDLSLTSTRQAIAEYHPENATEARLVAQANGLYNHGMLCLSESSKQGWLLKEEHYTRNAIKLLRLHNETVLALNKLRRGGEQKMIVQHVNIEGGQAAFMTGNFQSGGGGEEKNED
jgi:hypothetical protein